MNRFIVQVWERNKALPMSYATDTQQDANRFANYYRSKSKYKYPKVEQTTLK